MENSTYYAIAFWVFAAASVIPAILILTSKEIVRMAFWLLASLGSIAGLYVLLGADFLAVAQLMLYVGGILILILFGIMLTKRSEVGARNTASVTENYAAIGLIAFLVIFLGLVQMIDRTPWQGAETIVQTGFDANTEKPFLLKKAKPTTTEIGGLLMTDFLLPFEIVSVLLLAALVGAAYIIRRREET